ncbi:Rod shape-determining protein MreC [Cyanobacterium stanieri PCC 7202]|uniref:Cell shape-determining protein MreC n=1 Tax=Cyanobacterium stanieri (strain ATCC 29140 / PCC 7202) TaxID=292563 RepID=K9YN91_CYASC|nr:Rod shape-determining protein MreC [Cyanobacterium stanieri PCC 7202]
MKIIRRWWHKNSSQLIWGLIALAIAFLIYLTQGALINETLYRISSIFRYDISAEQERLYGDRTIQQLENEINLLRTQNQELRDIVNYQNQNPENLITARIIGRSPDSWWQIVTLDAGSNQGIQEDDPVIAIGGLVGRITGVTPNTSRVLLLSDYNSRVGATLNRTGYQGFVKGQSTQIGIMEFYEKVTDVQEGDFITTSNISTLFPPDIPIGKVVSINLNRSPAPEAEIEFTSPMDFLNWVMVMTN